jgi:signal transduction histidine kinase
VVAAENIRRLSQFFRLAYNLIIGLLIIILVGASAADRYNVHYYWTALREISQATVTVNDQESFEIELPCVVDSVKVGDKVTVSFEAEVVSFDNLLFHVTGASLDIYIDDALIYQTGQQNTYPRFQKTPAPQISMLDLPITGDTESGSDELSPDDFPPGELPLGRSGSVVYTTGRPVRFRFEYTVAPATSQLRISRFHIGDTAILFLFMLRVNSLSFIMAFVIFMAGLVLAGIALISIRATSAAVPMFWLGVGCLAFGLWQLISNELSIYFIPLHSLVYTLAYLSMLAVSPAMTIFYRRILERPRSWVLRTLDCLSAVLALSTVALHLSGTAPFAVTGGLIRAFVPTVFVVLGGFVLIESTVLHDQLTKNLTVPAMVLAGCTLVDLFDLLVFGGVLSGLTLRIGFMFFTVWMAIFGARHVNQRLETARQSERLAIELETITNTLEKQREHYHSLSETSEQIRVMRHDMRHQLSVLRGYLGAGDTNGALAYIDLLDQSTPSYAQMMLTDNFAVNAVISHYLTMAAENDISTDLQLVVPADLGQISENDMSIIFGNLFENAIEASLYLPEEQRVIRMRSRVVGKNLTLTVDNAFDGNYDARGGVFYSRKRTGRGIGLTSVQTIVERYQGSMKIEAANNQFMVSLMVRM